jgi:hypothetical protein
LSFAEGPEGWLSPFVTGRDVDVVGGPFVTAATDGMMAGLK